MEIVGYTKYGYLVELTPRELASITGDSSQAVHEKAPTGRGYSHEIGRKFSVNEGWEHIQRIKHTVTERKYVADTLRKMADTIETVPVIVQPGEVDVKDII